MHKIQFQHVSIDGRFTMETVLGTATYVKTGENKARLLAHTNSIYLNVPSPDIYGIGRIDPFHPSELVSLINPSWGIGGCDVS